MLKKIKTLIKEINKQYKRNTQLQEAYLRALTKTMTNF